MSQKPNVIQVIADQHNAAWLGCAGHPQARTPHLDRFAAEGARFEAAYAQNPICTPSRTSILSGQYCHNTGCYGLGGPKPVRLPSFMGHFRAHGYRTAASGPGNPLTGFFPSDSPESPPHSHMPFELYEDCH